MTTPGEDWNLVMPFVVTASNGGPYEDGAFVAGCYFGQITEAIRVEKHWQGYVPTPLVTQLDLLAMHHHMVMRTIPLGGSSRRVDTDHDERTGNG